MIKKLPRLFRNFYFVTGICFLVWMTFLDENDLITRYKMGAKLRSLEREKEFYKERIAQVETEREELTTNKALLEKYAREKYLMKKESEDVFIIQEER
jgi:cell division protein FtsB